MAEQLNLLSSGQILPTALHSEMQRSYLEYAMSVIVGRALPDVRDGLKPVHRRILYAMHELGLTPDRPYRKCARVVGDVLGKYHPHGDQAVYDAMVRLIQDFSSRFPLLDGHGNFGSVDNDPPAAMRYTETRLAALAQDALLSEIDEATVDFTSNFDNSQQEPTVLPAQLPVLLLNGCSGIAVGMATNVPPHNLGEIVDGLIALIDRPDLEDEKLFGLIPGPDFPTGGEITSTQGIRDAYTTGRGSIPLRGVATVEEMQAQGRGRHRRTAIVVTELPFQVNKAAWIEKVAALVNGGQLDGISDIRDESDREGIRVVIELKREFAPQAVLRQLYKQTPLQVNFGAIFLAIAEGQPRQLSLRQTLQAFLEFREQTLRRRYTHELEQTETQLHLVSGLIRALEHLDEVIDILRQAADGPSAKAALQEQLEFSEAQANGILAMPLRRLTGLERQNLQNELAKLTERQRVLQTLLSDRREFFKALKKELRALKKKFNNPRRTRIIANGASSKSLIPPDDEEQGLEAAMEDEAAIVEFTQRGYVRRLSASAFDRQRQTKGKSPDPRSVRPQDDFPLHAQATRTRHQVIAFTKGGKVYAFPVGDIPVVKERNTKGIPLVNLLPSRLEGNADAIVTQLILDNSDTPAKEADIVLLSQQGRIKRLPKSEFENITARGLTVIKLKDDDELFAAYQVTSDSELVLATSGGRVLRFEATAEQLPELSRMAQGTPALRLRKQENLVGCGVARPDQNLLLVSRRGHAKRLPLHLLRLGNRGEIGTQAMQFTTKADALVGMAIADPETEVALLTSNGRFLLVPIEAIACWGKDGAGDRLSQLETQEQIQTVLLCREEGIEN